MYLLGYSNCGSCIGSVLFMNMARVLQLDNKPVNTGNVPVSLMLYFVRVDWVLLG